MGVVPADGGGASGTEAAKAAAEGARREPAVGGGCGGVGGRWLRDEARSDGGGRCGRWRRRPLRRPRSAEAAAQP